ncbi:MAG: O-antigen ligase family protein [bacterium]|nr:O-antigen ligase family protein [bacterium]
MLTIAWVITLASSSASFSPRLLVSLLIVFFLLASYTLIVAGRLNFLIYLKNPLFLSALTFVGYILLSALWSKYPLTAMQKALWLTLIIFAISMTPLLFSQMSSLQLHRCARGIVSGLIIGMVFLLAEYATDFAILSFLAKHFPGLVQTAGPAKQIPAYYLNNSVTVITLLLWPALLIALAWIDKIVKSLYLTVLIGTIAFILYKTESATAQLAFVLAGFAWLTARFAPNHIKLIAYSLWMGTVIGVVPVIMAIHFAGFQNLSSLPYSFRDRLHIWNYTATLVPANPLLGIGIRSSRANKIAQHRTLSRKRQGKLVDHKGWHNHNAFLQTWYELGAVGAAFLLVIGLLTLRAIDRIKLERRPFAYAMFTSFSIAAAFGYGMWQSWLLAAYGWGVILLLIGLQYKGEKDIGLQSPPSPEQE